MLIEKSVGLTATEQYLSRLCDRTFLNLWSYANPCRSDGKELCDLIAVFEDAVFLFFDRESRRFDEGGDVQLNWDRWKKEVVDKQIRTAAGAKRYLLENRDRVFLDPKAQKRLPLAIPAGELRIYKIVVAHGAMEACKNSSISNIYGSLGISYEPPPLTDGPPFFVSLDNTDPIHIFDSHNLELVLRELDTLCDFETYLAAKERAIARYKSLVYCGEEDLLAHYLLNFDPVSQSYMIGVKDKTIDNLMIGEGEWHDFVRSAPYHRRKEHNQISYMWDRLIQKTGQNVLNGTIGGNSNVFLGQSAIHEMAKEPRLARRALAEMMATSIKNFPDNATGNVRNLLFFPSSEPNTGYVFLQLYQEQRGDYETVYRPFRRTMLEFACGAAKLKFQQLTKIVGIAIDAPKYYSMNSEDFILLNCENWTAEDQKYFEEANKELQFFQTKAMRENRLHVTDFPAAHVSSNRPKIGRNQLCPCGSGKKYKRCHGRPGIGSTSKP